MSKPTIAIVTVALMGATAVASAQEVACDSLVNPVYLQVGDTQEPLLKALGKRLRAEAEPITIVYVTSGSCTNIEAIYTAVPISTNPKFIPDDPSWMPSTDASPTCTIAEGGHAIDIANSALFVSACNPDPPPATVGLFQGPVQAYLFAVPEASSQVAITAEEAYFVFGFGAAGQAAPWVDEAMMFIRPVTKSTLLTLAAAIGVPGAKWKGVPLEKSTEVVTAVSESADPEKTIGILGAEIYDGKRDVLNALAFQAYDQFHGYYPDSTASATDKQNVRDGHYLPWSPTVWMTALDGEGVVKDARAKRIIDMILGLAVDPAPSFDPLEVVVSKGLVPDCAMKVTRSYEGGELSHYQPAEPCACYYDTRVGAQGAADCTACEDDGPCGAGKCRHGFCEAR